MRVLVDTNIIIDHLRGVTEAGAYLKNIERGELEGLISSLSIMELFAAPRFVPEDEEIINEILGIFEVVTITPGIARSAGKLLGQYRRSHGLEPIDALIAATALASDAVLLTRNEEHFKFIDGLLVVKP